MLKWEQTFVAYSECGQYKIEVDEAAEPENGWDWSIHRLDDCASDGRLFVEEGCDIATSTAAARLGEKALERILAEDKKREELRSAAKYPVFTFPTRQAVPYLNMPQMRAFQAGDYIFFRGEYLSRAEANRRAAEENKEQRGHYEFLKKIMGPEQGLCDFDKMMRRELHRDEKLLRAMACAIEALGERLGFDYAEAARDSVNYVAKYGFKHDPNVLEDCRADEFSCPVLESNVEKTLEARIYRTCDDCNEPLSETSIHDGETQCLSCYAQALSKLPTPSRPVLVTNILDKEQSGYDQILAQLKREASEVEL